jgi:hypothetical protein
MKERKIFVSLRGYLYKKYEKSFKSRQMAFPGQVQGNERAGIAC